MSAAPIARRRPRAHAPAAEFCPVYDAIRVLQGKWTLHIVSALLEGACGFNELARTIGGCNPATLAERLDTLEQLGLITKTVESTMPPRTSYALTRAGEGLREVIGAIDRWGQRHLRKDAVRALTVGRRRRRVAR
jgi:DNA-binding HxlR family transcriptional regulator